MSVLFNDTIVIRRASWSVDAFGNDVPDWTTAAAVTVDGVAVQPGRASTESSDGTTDQTVTWFSLFTEIGSGDLDLLSTDRVEYAGLTLEVYGDVARWPDPFTGAVSKVEATLRLVQEASHGAGSN